MANSSLRTLSRNGNLCNSPLNVNVSRGCATLGIGPRGVDIVCIDWGKRLHGSARRGGTSTWLAV